MQGIDGHSSSKFHTAAEENYDEITEVWEASVRETHDFVSQGDIEAFKKIVRGELLPKANVVYTRDDEDKISGFVGVIGDKMEMIFIAPKFLGKGLGKRLFWHAVCEMRADKLDVNESNTNAVNFYLRQGCKVTGRSSVDAMGHPYPVLHLEWPHSS